MPLDATSPQIDALLIGAVLQMELSDRDLQVAQKRYSLIPEHLSRPSSPLRSLMDDALVYPQGSRAIGATVVHGDSDDRFDLDAILELPTPKGWSPSDVLDNLEVSFEGFPDVREIVRCTRCVQLKFAFMHLDVTPMAPFSEPRSARTGDIFHSPEHGNDQTFSVNPYGFAEWFKSKIVMPNEYFQSQVNVMRSRLGMRDVIARGSFLVNADIDSLPATISPIRDATQVLALKLLKRFLNLRYASRDMKRPVSIYLSKIAALTPPNEFGLCAHLETLAGELERRMTYALQTEVWPDEKNPDFPLENFNDRWPKDQKDMEVFKADLLHLQIELARSRESSLSDIQDIFDDLFGERVAGKAVRSYLDGLSATAAPAAFERTKGYVAAPGLLAGVPSQVAEVSRAPAHKFHASILKK